MKLLILAETYPMPGGPVCPMYIHMRNLYYKRQGADVVVLNFRARHSYQYEDVQVITLKDFIKKKDAQGYDLLVSHASNIKHHYCFIKKWGRQFADIVFVFHGHEVLRSSTVYPPLYSWKRQNRRGIKP